MVFDTRDFGVLVRFFNRLMGVIPSMELQRRNLKPDDFVKGKVVHVKVTEVDERRRRLNLVPANTEVDEEVDILVRDGVRCEK